MAGSGASGFFKASWFRWLCLVRLVVTTVVTVLAAVVVVRAVFLMFHPQKLQLRIPTSSVLVRRYSNVSESSYLYAFTFYLQAINHRHRTFIYYNNITIRLLDSSDPPLRPKNLTIVEFSLMTAISLSQRQQEEYYLTKTRYMILDEPYVQRLFSKEPEPSNMTVAMVVDGLLTDYVEGVIGTNVVYRAAYNCVQLKLLSNDDLPKPSDNNAADCAPIY